MNKGIKVQTTELGPGFIYPIGTTYYFAVYQDFDNYAVAVLTGITRTQLMDGLIIQVDMSTTKIKIDGMGSNPCGKLPVDGFTLEFPLPTRTPTPTPTITPTISLTPSITPTISLTPSITPTNTPTISLTPSITPTNTPTRTVTPTPTVTPSITPTNTVTPSITPTTTPTPTPSPLPVILQYEYQYAINTNRNKIVSFNAMQDGDLAACSIYFPSSQTTSTSVTTLSGTKNSFIDNCFLLQGGRIKATRSISRSNPAGSSGTPRVNNSNMYLYKNGVLQSTYNIPGFNVSTVSRSDSHEFTGLTISAGETWKILWVETT